MWMNFCACSQIALTTSGCETPVEFTAIPAAFVSYVPVEALRTMSMWQLALSACGAFAIAAVGTAAFYLGLRRYESGNLLSMHG